MKPRKTKEKPFTIDFLAGKLRYRSMKAGLRNELLARAIGVKPADNPYIVDGTAGVGRDSFILASLGFSVTMIEKNAVLYALLSDAITRALQDEKIAPIVKRLTLIHADTEEWLQSTPHKPDIIYLDPMFPERKKSSSVKKDMAFLQELLGEPHETKTFLETALACATKRVVVKRPRLAQPFANIAPHHAILGKTSRFDVYVI